MLRNGIVSTVAGCAGESDSVDGSGEATSRLQYPTGITVAPDGAVYVTELLGGRIRKLNVLKPKIERIGTALRPLTSPGE